MGKETPLSNPSFPPRLTERSPAPRGQAGMLIDSPGRAGLITGRRPDA